MNFQRRSRLWVPEAPNLILGRGPCPRPSIELEVVSPAVRFAGYFTVELIHAATGHVRQKLHFKNTIVTAGFDDWLGTNGRDIEDVLQYCAVGTGSTAPNVADTALETQKDTRINSNGGTSDTAGFNTTGTDYGWFRRTRLFPEADHNDNLTELGFFRLSSGVPMWCRQLFRDSGGSPVTVVKTAADQLRITYELRAYPPADGAGTVSLAAVNYDFVTRAIGQGASNVWSGLGAGAMPATAALAVDSRQAEAKESSTLLAIASLEFGNTDSTSCTPTAYVNGNLWKEVTAIWDPGIANFASGIGSVFHGYGQSGGLHWQFQFTPTKIPKDNTKRLTLVIRSTYTRHAF